MPVPTVYMCNVYDPLLRLGLGYFNTFNPLAYYFPTCYSTVNVCTHQKDRYIYLT
jgi:hypothetical protein